MGLRKISKKLIDVEENGQVVEFFEGYCDEDDVATLPTDGVCEGSNVIVTDSGDWYFYNENSKTWNPLLNVSE